MIKICVGKNCRLKKSQEILKTLDSAIRKSGLKYKTKFLGITLCSAHCDDGPIALYKSERFCRISLADAREIAGLLSKSDQLDEKMNELEVKVLDFSD